MQNSIKPVYPFNSRWVIKDMSFTEWLNYLKVWQHIGHGNFVRKNEEFIEASFGRKAYYKRSTYYNKPTNE